MSQYLYPLKLLKWQLQSRYGRFEILCWLLASIPGEFGIYVRRKALSKYFKKVGTNLRIFPNLRVRNPQLLSLGDNVSLGNDCFIQAAGEVDISDNVVLGPGVKIWSANHVYGKGMPVTSHEYEFKRVEIKRNVWLAANAFIMPGCELGEGTIVSAGSVVGAKKYPPHCVIAGNPARIIKKLETNPDIEIIT